MSQVTTAFYTEAHRIEGELVVTERLSEKLNDPLTDFIELRGARITSLLHDVDGPGVVWPVATIPKSTILVATLDMQEHESRETRIDKVQSKKGSEVGVIVGSIEVYGTGHLQFTGPPTRVLTTQLQSYFPVTNAVILLGQRQGDNRRGTGLALVNRSMIRAFTMS
ncbi:MAG: hypothetical protein ACKVIQ_19420 [Acidimicrobiales bacterium]|jgi:hypothetical protein